MFDLGFFAFLCVFGCLGGFHSSSSFPGNVLSQRDCLGGFCVCGCVLIEENMSLDDQVAKYICKQGRNCLFSVYKMICVNSPGPWVSCPS